MNDVKVELKDYNIEIQMPYADRGLPGKSAYELAVEHGYSGTEEQWLATLVGPYFTPSVSSDGTLSWTNNGDLVNPTPRNIRGPQGVQGETGATGNGIASIEKIGTVDLVDTYRITYTNGDTFTYTITNGYTQDLSDYVAKDNSESYVPTSDYNPATKKYVDDSITSAITTTLSGSY